MNTYFVQLALDTGMCRVTKMAEQLGVKSGTGTAPVDSYHDKPSFTLGSVEVSPLSMAEAYATFAARRHPLRPGDRLEDHRPQRQDARSRRAPTASG